MEKEYKQKLLQDFGIEFNSLYTLYNNPMGRFGAFLQRSGNLKRYMKKLFDAFNALLIVDSDTYTWCLQKYLQHRGYPVKTACTLKEARTAIQEEITAGGLL